RRNPLRCRLLILANPLYFLELCLRLHPIEQESTTPCSPQPTGEGMIVLWKRLLEAGLSPLGVITWLFAFGLLLTILSWQSRVGCWPLIAGAVLFLVWLYSPLADIGFRYLENQYAPLVQPPSSAVDRIVILAGYGKTQPSIAVMSTVSPQTLCNLAEGLRLYRRLPTSKML